ncbi:MAG TPA: signal peptidase I [Candidatus Xenobia bacterium]|nr:signal peptidase I [Candidatus Xenobia bacterium]
MSDEKDRKDEKEQPEGSEQGTLREYVDSLLVTVILALFGITFVVQAFKIPSQSMEDTLLVGDHLLVNKFVFADGDAEGFHVLPYREVRRGDVVVFKFPVNPPYTHFVKRVIGLPGDRLRIENRQVFINGEPLEEPYKIHRLGLRAAAAGVNFPPPPDGYYSNMNDEWYRQMNRIRQGDEIVIPPGKYFVMGDNRDNSHDSRFWGLVDRSNIIGRPLLIYWSFDSSSRPARSEPETRGAGWDRLSQFASRTRWNRLLHLVR